ncbi:protein unc-13 homolog [Phragmites australis]|uniref:protein unc-13 homolog n=1 Tax=Phragmites australis TaxID=29695 RepID=UPI002D7A068D|nr:protein unc-13 homolog [Phragmites australis]XP_062226468.1 protein unc-13 homolog [Phragmites australis]XP_062226469.1 protein unc-13 homolog [Phragmites australis]XP_062226470.1 protein unc-13 homolog [Phragmites australis]XP_062226472.1 protein unc-13 homolog [Phragmites australis]XP_062226473.1 protein unc-13 homolog [Phragmites australis]XP_062226474.1 protein unc-13 homolog [Phragmites australis]XP_062226475.1 protein unc-13 homolog [Phragmites australis]
MDPASLLEVYRRDRRRLLGFLLSAGGGGGLAVDLSRVDLNAVSADYALECVASGAQFDASEATRRYFDERRYPIMIGSPSGNSYFLLSSSEPSDSPPKEAAPCIGPQAPTQENSSPARQPRDFFRAAVNISEMGYGAKDVSLSDISPQRVNKVDILSLGLPELSTELSDDDIRETAYEVLLAALVVSGKIHFSEEKREKKPKFLKGLRSKVEGSNSSPQLENNYSQILDLIRVQMEISESMDTLTKRALRLTSLTMEHGHLDVPRISLQLLNSVGKLDFPTERLRVQWHRRQANVLEELLLFSASREYDMSETLRIVLSKLKNTEGWVVSVPEGRVEVLTIIERYNTKLSALTKKFGLKDETYHWAQNYHFNFRLYEKLLCSVFDILEDGQLVEEADEILEIAKLTWPILGITEKLHGVFYAWVLFQKFAQTGEILLLKRTSLQIQKLQLHHDIKEIELYTNSFICSAEACGSNRALNLVDSTLLKINVWCRHQLENYHAYFSKNNFSIFESMLNLVLLSAINSTEDGEEETMLIETPVGSTPESKLIHLLVVRSIQAAYKQALISSDGQSKTEFKHPLTMLANEVKLVAEKECTAFSPILHKYYPEAQRVALIFLHLLYGQQLELFLERIDHSENSKEILAASNNFELFIAQNLYSVYGEAVGSSLSSYLKPYMIGRFSSPLILQWLHAQHENVLEWTKRTIEIEDWEPLSAHEKQSTSVVEVFRIVEETVDQFFNSSLPLDIVHLRSLLIGITSSLQVYLMHMENQQVSGSTLLPSAPVLTRYAESMNPFAKRKVIEPTVPEEKVASKLNNLSVPKLCVKLSTLQFIRDQLDTIEEGIKHSWVSFLSAARLLDYLSCMASGRAVSKILSSSDESVDELFTIFDDVRMTAVKITDTILKFIGTRAVFWDMRDSLLLSLYRDSVEGARMEIFIPSIDQVLDQVCDLIVDVLRDQVVLRIFQACMAGFIWVLLDGGPSRAFLETDVDLMQQDLAMLKDLFVAEGQGLPLDVVEKEAKQSREILDLYMLKADTIIEMLIHASDQMSNHLEFTSAQRRHVHDAHTLLRVLCHKKDKIASTFLKIQYHLPRSSDYDDVPVKDASYKVPIFSEMLKKSTSFNWSETGQQSFRIMKKKLQEASWQ